MRTLIIIDVQHDFLPGGALAVPGGDRVIPALNQAVAAFDLVVATQDWHPPDHGSFASSHPGRRPGELITLAGRPQILWPAHCVQGTRGAELHPQLDLRRAEAIIRKGTAREVDSYSAFFDNAQERSTGLADYLRGRGARALWLAGLATDYCVKASVLDALRLGFVAHVLAAACAAVDLTPGDGERALAALGQAGARVEPGLPGGPTGSW